MATSVPRFRQIRQEYGPASLVRTTSFPVFEDRLDAGAQLAERLEPYRGQDVLVLGILRGGVPVAAAIADRLAAELDVVVARKLGAPLQPELAIGAVTANGGRFLNKDLAREPWVSEDYLVAITEAEMAEARRRENRFRAGRPRPRIANRTVVLVDDGLATGATMRAAVRSVRLEQPSRLIVAVPVGPRETCAALRKEADEVITLYEPEDFGAVGLYYEDFTPTQDAEVQQLLLAAARATGELDARDAP
jgi:putative phosphoribosyl transferase